MKRCNRMMVTMFVAALGAGCVRETAPTVEYFRAHQDERMAQLARCANEPGSLQHSPACVNAQQAADLERRNSLRDLPSMGLNGQTSAKPDEEPATDRTQ